MGKLINAEKLLESLACIEPTEQWIHWDDIVDTVKDLPAAEPEIIRCKDCKHYKEWESEYNPNAVVTQCMADNVSIRKVIPDGWYCAGAERRTGE